MATSQGRELARACMHSGLMHPQPTLSFECPVWTGLWRGKFLKQHKYMPSPNKIMLRCSSISTHKESHIQPLTSWCRPPARGFCVSTGAMKSQGITLVPEKWMLVYISTTGHRVDPNMPYLGGLAGRRHAVHWYQALPTQWAQWSSSLELLHATQTCHWTPYLPTIQPRHTTHAI